jgi:hypothetical protein
MTLALRRRLQGSCGGLLVGVGAFAQAHPEFDGGASLVLLGIALLERASGVVRRWLRRLVPRGGGRGPRGGASPRMVEIAGRLREKGGSWRSPSPATSRRPTDS